MERRDCDLIERHYKRLEQCLEPRKLLRYLNQAGVLDEDDVESFKPTKGESHKRETQVQTLLDILKRRERGLKHFIKALLRSKIQDYLGRELLEDEVFTEEGRFFELLKVYYWAFDRATSRSSPFRTPEYK